MKRKILRAAVAAAALSFGTLAADAATKACFIYVGPIGDFGWSYQHHQGLEQMKAALGDQVETAYLESVPEGADAERAIERFARSGCNIIFTTSFGYMDADQQGGRQVPRREVRARHRLQARPSERLDLQFEVLRGPLRAGRDRRQDVQGRRRRLHRLVPDPRGGDGHQRLRARRAVGQPGLQGEGGVGQHLVRSRQGSRRRQGADRPGRRHHHPAHQFHGGHAGGDRARHQGVRAGLRHDQVRPGDPADLDRRQLGPVLHRARQGGDRRHLEAVRTYGAA